MHTPIWHHHAVKLLASTMIVAALAACSNEGKPTASAQAPATEQTANPPQMHVYKTATCGCCGAWVEHVQNAGFGVTVENVENLGAIKAQHSIAPRYQSCHTGVIEDYVFEGHIPATVIQKFLAEKPPGAIGLAVPGMPAGSPGMEMGARFDSYDVLLLRADGSSEVYTHIAAP